MRLYNPRGRIDPEQHRLPVRFLPDPVNADRHRITRVDGGRCAEVDQENYRCSELDEVRRPRPFQLVALGLDEAVDRSPAGPVTTRTKEAP